jgi:hypothetical protein
MIDEDGDFYLVQGHSVIHKLKKSFVLTECDDISHLFPTPEYSPSLVALEWWNSKHCTWPTHEMLLPLVTSRTPLPGLPLPSYIAPKEFVMGPAVAFNQVTLADICLTEKWVPNQARRILRKHIENPPNRWEWSVDQVPKIKELIRAHYKA